MTLGILFIVAGIFTLLMTLIKPSFYWNSRKAMRLRRLVGDPIASIIYILIAIFCISYGIRILL
jgi:vacuolar-type H+-ATPase subunit I/STV1